MKIINVDEKVFSSNLISFNWFFEILALDFFKNPAHLIKPFERYSQVNQIVCLSIYSKIFLDIEFLKSNQLTKIPGIEVYDDKTEFWIN